MSIAKYVVLSLQITDEKWTELQGLMVKFETAFNEEMRERNSQLRDSKLLDQLIITEPAFGDDKYQLVLAKKEYRQIAEVNYTSTSGPILVPEEHWGCRLICLDVRNFIVLFNAGSIFLGHSEVYNLTNVVAKRPRNPAKPPAYYLLKIPLPSTAQIHSLNRYIRLHEHNVLARVGALRSSGSVAAQYKDAVMAVYRPLEVVHVFDEDFDYELNRAQFRYHLLVDATEYKRYEINKKTIRLSPRMLDMLVMAL